MIVTYIYAFVAANVLIAKFNLTYVYDRNDQVINYLLLNNINRIITYDKNCDEIFLNYKFAI